MSLLVFTHNLSVMGMWVGVGHGAPGSFAVLGKHIVLSSEYCKLHGIHRDA